MNGPYSKIEILFVVSNREEFKVDVVKVLCKVFL